MQIARNWLFAGLAGALLALATLAWAENAVAQQSPNGRDCQTIRTCNYTRGGVYRGCLSSYSCRVCKFIRTSCTIDGTRKTCQAMKCAWG